MNGPYLFWVFKYVVIFAKENVVSVAAEKRGCLVLLAKGKIQLLR